MTTSRTPAVVDALVSALTAALPATVKVYDGQPATKPASTASFITVGWTPQGDTTSGEQEWSDVGNQLHAEQIDIPCYCDSYSGSTAASARRTAAFALMASAEDALRTDPNLGGAVPQTGWAQIGAYTEHQEQTDAGLTVGVVFHVVVQILAQ